MYLLVSYVMPDGLKSRSKGRIPGMSDDIRHSCIKIQRTYGVSDCFTLLADRQMRLIIRAFRITSDTSYIDKLPCHIKIKLLPRRLVQLYQRKLNLLMSGSLHDRFAVIVGRIAFKEDLVDMACALFCDIEPFTLAGSLIIGYRSFIHMAHIIKFMTCPDTGIRTVTRRVGTFIH